MHHVNLDARSDWEGRRLKDGVVRVIQQRTELQQCVVDEKIV